MNYMEVAELAHIDVCRHCHYELHKYCYTWDICTARLMEILAINMIREGEYYG